MKTQRSSLTEKKMETSSDELLQKVEDIMTSGIDPIKHFKWIDYPRRAGTEGDRKVADYIFTTLQEYGFQPKTHEFHFLEVSPRFTLIPPLLFICWGLLSLINILYLENNLIISVVILSVLAIALLALLKLNIFVKFFLDRKAKQMQILEEKIKHQRLNDKEEKQVMRSKNIIAEVGTDEAEKYILFTAHIDTISSKFSMRIMKNLVILSIISFGAYSGAYLLNVIGDFFFHWNFMKELFPLFLILLILVSASLGILFMSQSMRSNESHGIIDDGTGIVILLELAKFLKDQNIQNYKFIFGFFSAEESGLIGSSYYYRKTQFDKNKLHVISFDMIGEKPPLAYIKGVNPIIKTPMNPMFNLNINEVAKKLNIEIKGSNFIYPGSDFAHWLFNGYKTNWFINSSKVVHSKQDNLNNVNEKLVNNALRLIIGYIIEYLS
ncbi:MAG: M28 family metallopeptidase [Promethearchaeota archaeon]